MRRVVVAGLAAVVIAGGGGAAAVWRADSGGAPSAATVASVQGPPVANAISCGSATSCLAVGSRVHGAAGPSAPVARALDAGSWRTVTVTSPGTPGMSSALTGVSCATAGYCLAVGDYDTASFGDPLPYAMAWNGSSLSPVAALPLPSGAYLDALGGVSCPAVNRCVVIGLVTIDGSDGNFTGGDLVWTWDGSAWSMTAVQTPATNDMENFGSLYCTSVTDCVAAGQRVVDLSGRTVPAFDTWDGISLTPHNPPEPTGMVFAGFSGLSCVSRKHCTAVGLGYGTPPSPITSFLDVWNGRNWNVTPWSGPPGTGDTELSAVSCVSASECVAVGSDGPYTDQNAAALIWNGITWAEAAVPGPGSAGTSLLGDVDCSEAGGCTAVGQTVNAGDSPNAAPVVGHWNGTAWRITTP